MSGRRARTRRPAAFLLGSLGALAIVAGGAITAVTVSCLPDHPRPAAIGTAASLLQTGPTAPTLPSALRSSEITPLPEPMVSASATTAAALTAQPASAAGSFGKSTPAPTPVPAFAASSASTATAATAGTATALTLAQKVGQMMMFGYAGDDPSAFIANFVAPLHVGNVVLLGDNVDTPAQLTAMDAALQRAAKSATGGIGAIISVDEEGGSVERLAPPAFAGLPSARNMAATGDPARVTAMGLSAGQQLKSSGINMDLAPVMDVNDNPANPVIGDRAFGVDPTTVQKYGMAFMQGLRSSGVTSVAKHFPGHGNTSEDSHFTLPFVTKTNAQLNAVELPPFESAVNAGVDGVMMAHVVYTAWDPDRPASLSHAIVTDILRDQLQYQGVVMTDDMNMDAIQQHWGPAEAAVQAVLAGDDIILTGGPPELEAASYNGVLAAVKGGRIPMARIDESVNRILKLKQKLGLMPAQ